MLSVKVHLHLWHLRIDPVRNPVVTAGCLGLVHPRDRKDPFLGLPPEEASLFWTFHSMHSSGLSALTTESYVSVFRKNAIGCLSEHCEYVLLSSVDK